MNYIFGYIGNTNIKICKLNKKFEIINTYLFHTKSPNLNYNLSKKFGSLLKKNISKNILFSSVVPKVFFMISKHLKKKKYKVFEIKNFNLKKIMKFNVKNFSQLGSDRIANSIAVLNKFKSNCIVIDFGTATTFDIISKNNIYLGGVIAPGIKLSIDNLFLSTALLPLFKLKKYPNNFGKNTKEALSAGFFWGYEGLIKNIIKKINEKNGYNSKIILTGGYAHLFKNRLSRKTMIQYNITIYGIFIIYLHFIK